jgi:hypothetical protein
MSQAKHPSCGLLINKLGSETTDFPGEHQLIPEDLKIQVRFHKSGEFQRTESNYGKP